MYVSFKLHSYAEKQLKLHKKVRIKIPEWEEKRLILDCEAELTYHHRGNTPTDHLQCVLNLDVTPSEEGNLDLSPAEDKQIPEEINEYIESLCKENDIQTLKKQNHDKEMNDQRMKAVANGKKYWLDLSNKQIMRVCSNGTGIAFGILRNLEGNRECFDGDLALSKFMHEQIAQKLGAGFEPRTELFMKAWHETCNPLGIWGDEENLLLYPRGSEGLKLIKAKSLD